MKRFSFMIGFMLFNAISFAQKPAIDKYALESWEKVDNGAISNDGNFILYKVRKLWQFGNQEKLVIRSVKSFREIKLYSNSGFSEQFSEDSERLYFQKNDSLGIVDLKSLKVRYVHGISSFQLFKGKEENLLVRKTERNSLSIQGASGNIFFNRDSVDKFWLSSDGLRLYFVTRQINGFQTLCVSDFSGHRTKEVFKGNGISQLIMDPKGDQIAFTEQNDNEQVRRYKYLTNTLESYSIRESKKVKPNEIISGLNSFSHDGKRIFLNLRRLNAKMKPDIVKVDVWSYTDTTLFSMQQKEGNDKNYLISLDQNKNLISRLQNDYENVSIKYAKSCDTTGSVTYRPAADFLELWNPSSKVGMHFINTVSGERSSLPSYVWSVTQSPEGKFSIGYDSLNIDLCSYSNSSSRIVNITQLIHFPQNMAGISTRPKMTELAIAGWLKGDEKLLVYDRYDIWLCDPLGIGKPVCLTKGIGRVNKITFRISTAGGSEKNIFNIGDELILSAFNQDTKDNGFYSLRIGNAGSMKKLVMGAYIFETPQNLGLGGESPSKARDANAYLIIRSDASTSPNYFYTKDFKKFKPISSVFPEKKYNWQRSKLFTWKDKRGNLLKGVLHYPENLDLNKKYPLILNYYEQKSDELNSFLEPYFTTGNLNVSWFVSNDYLVFTPDVEFTVGYMGRSTLEAIESAADELVKLNYVDEKRMGLQGHSFSGYTTNYIVAHSNRFAAAVAGSGNSNLVSNYNTIYEPGDGSTKQNFIENGQYNMKCTLWDNQRLYIENSPVLHADKINTPLLLMSNKTDGRVAYTQGVEMYLALRRLGKRCWMLQYDEGSHHVHRVKDAEDYTMRMMQFFDHYLKDRPAPLWMTRGIMAKDKGMRLGYEFDKEIKTPGAGLVPDVHN